jgi:hypothetical protein
MDHLKTTNDRFGHGAGARQCCSRLQSKRSTAERVGGSVAVVAPPSCCPPPWAFEMKGENWPTPTGVVRPRIPLARSLSVVNV